MYLKIPKSLKKCQNVQKMPTKILKFAINAKKGKKPFKKTKSAKNAQKCKRKFQKFTRSDKNCQKVRRRGNLIVLVLLSTDFNRFSVSHVRVFVNTPNQPN